MSLRRTASALLALALTLAATPLCASSFLDPRLQFRTIETEHFRIYFHAGEERLAAHLAEVAETVWPQVGRALGVAAPRLTHVMLVDQNESANGWATPLPYNTVYVTAAAPAGHEFLGNERDWLRLVFTHEFTHIVHLDRSLGWTRIFRAAFGRTPVAFPNVWLPRWQIEGLAVWEESQLTGEGRRYAGDFRALETVRDGRVPLDRANGGLTAWPGGQTPYSSGVGFHEYLADRFKGEQQFAALAENTARRIPFWSAPAFKHVYGESLGTLWEDYQAVIADEPAASAASSATRVTFHGFGVSGPRFLPPTCETCVPQIAYTRRGPDEFPALYATDVPGTKEAGSSEPRRLTTRYLGDTTGVDRAAIVFDQQELRRNSGSYSDLFVFERTSGRTRALTRESRLQEPDLSPDGLSIAAVQDIAGSRALVLLPLSESLRTPGGAAAAHALSTTTLVGGDGVLFNTPRWSPDGSSLAAIRQRPGTLAELVVVDIRSRQLRVVATSASARVVTPAWTPDGRGIVAAVAGESEPFNLVLFPADDPGARVRRLTTTAGGALWPDISSDGRQLAYAGYTVSGFDVFVMPFDVDAATLSTDSLGSQAETTGPQPLTPPQSRTYRPWRTLAPTSWFPELQTDYEQTRVGASFNGADVLRRHLYAATATWLATSPDGAATPDRGVPDWDVTYAYDRWRPTLFVSSSSETRFAGGPPGRDGRPTNITVLEREVQAGVILSAQHVRATHRALTSIVGSTDRLVGPGQFVNGDHVAVRVGGSSTTAHTFGYSISRERGIDAGATIEMVREALGASADGTSITADFRAYLPVFRQHDVVALRLGGGTTTGPAGVRRIFVMGGVDSVGDVLNFSRDAFSLLRGFESGSFAGEHVALFNADYRVALLRPERGLGTWPIFLHTVHATAFADAGHTWSGTFQSRDIKTSLGGELVLDLVAGYTLPVSLAFGGAWGHDGAAARDRGLAYVRLSRTF